MSGTFSFLSIRPMLDRSRAADDDVVDGDEDELHRVADEAHDRKTDGASHRDLLELLGVGLRAPLDQPARVSGELDAARDNPADRVVLVREEGHGLEFRGRHGVSAGPRRGWVQQASPTE
mmetsp:Transcript_316/g.237  ORF Transcript_316/g.237 Transcript_316/m.237 type:complete len:120 (-) Transcript_316:23-382(-)